VQALLSDVGAVVGPAFAGAVAALVLAGATSSWLAEGRCTAPMWR